MVSRFRPTAQSSFLCALLAAGILPSATAHAADPATVTAAGTPNTAATTPLPMLNVTGSPLVDTGGLSLDRPNTTGSRLNLTPLQIPASVQTITGERLRSWGDRSVLEGVTRATGITAVATPGNGNAGLSARGFSGVTSVMQLYDGVQLYVGAGTVTFPFSPATVDHIDVLSGPASVLYGQGAIGGVVNVVPLKPDGANPSTTGQVTIGSYDTARETFDTTGPLGPISAYRLTVGHAQSDGWVDRGSSDSLAISGSFRIDPTPDLHLTFSEDYGDQRPMGYFGTPLIRGVLPASLRDRNFNVQDSTIHWVDNFTQFKTEYTPSDAVTLHNDFYYLGTNRHFREAEGYAFQPATGVIQRNTYLEIFHHESQVGDHGDATASGRILGHRNDATIGFDVNSVTFESVSNTPFGGTTNLNPFNFSPGNLINLVGTVPRFRTQTSQEAVFAEDRFGITDALSLIGGVRHDEYELHRTDLTPYGVTSVPLSNTSWRVGTVYEVIPNLSLYAQYATAADPISSLISLTPSQQAFTLATGRQIEVGAKQSFWQDRGEWTFTAYHITKDNILSTNPTNPALTQQVGQQSSRGLEAAVSIEIGGGWRISANGTVLEAQFDDFSEKVGSASISRKGNVPINVPQRAANLWLDWAFASGWQAGAGLRYVGHRYADNANTLVLPGYTVVDAGVRWTPLNQLRVDLHLYNAFDTLYAAAPYNGGSQWILGEPLSVELSLTAKY